MANEEHVSILKQGVAAWNEWRKEHPVIRAHLSVADLRQAYLRGADLSQAHLSGVDLSGVDLRRAILSDANLSDANLSEADLSWADLRGADLSGADLSRAHLVGTYLRKADLNRAYLVGADFRTAIMSGTNFDDIDLSEVKGLDLVTHAGPSYIDIHTIYRSNGNIPEAFLRGAGVPDNFITYMKSLTGDAIQYYSCFISYSSKDEALARRLYNDLQAHGVRCWFAPEDLKWGAETRQGIDEAIRVHDKLLLILSKASVESNWVQKEVETAFEQEALRKKQKQKKATVLFPIRIDTAVMKSESAWAADIRRMRNIGDFTHWKDHDAYQQAFDRLLRDLKAQG